MPQPPPMSEPDPIPTLPDHLSTVLAGHRAFRRDTGRFIQALGRLDPTDEATTTTLVAWFGAAMQALHHHHAIEDAIFWPALRRRSRAFAATDELMQDEHKALDAAIENATSAVQGLRAATSDDRAAARRHAEDAVVRMRAILVEHLEHEEAVALPLLGEAFTVEEYRRLDQKVTELFEPKELGFGACWYLDAATPRERAAIWAGFPLLFRLLYRLKLQRDYRRIAAVLPDHVATTAPIARAPRAGETSMTRVISTTATAEVAAPFAQVWELVSDLDRYDEWVHGTLEVRDADPVARLGARYTERNRVVGPLTARSIWTVVALDREHGHQRHESSGSPGIRSFAVVLDLEPSSAGTSIALTLEAEVAAGPATRPLAWLLARALPPSNERTLHSLADLAESESVVSAPAAEDAS